MANIIFTERQSSICLKIILKEGKSTYTGKYNSHYGYTGYHLENDTWVVWDNTTGDCWVEEFNTEEKCQKYLNGEDPENLRD